jgi:hypothetical protein
VVLDPLGIFYRVADGKRLAALPVETSRKFPYALYRRTYLPFGNVLVLRVSTKKISISKEKVSIVGVRVRAEDRESLAFEELWRLKGGTFSGLRYHGRAYLGLLGRGRGAALFDPETGAYGESQKLPLKYAFGWSVIVGDHLIDWGGDRRHKLDTHRRAAVPFTVSTVDLRSGAVAATPPLLDARWAEDRAFWERWTYRGNVQFVANGSITPQAGRLFLRTLATTWCLGDKSKPFPVNDRWPAAARIGRTSPKTAPGHVALAEVVAALSDGSQDRRQAAVRTLAGLSDKTDLSEKTVAALVAAHAHATGARRNDLARALGAIGPKAAAAAPALARDVIEADRGTAVSAGWALSRMGSAAEAALAPVMDWLRENVAKEFDRSKGAVPIKRFLAAGMAVGGVLGADALDAAAGEAHPRNRAGLAYAGMVLDGSVLEGPDRPAPWPGKEGAGATHPTSVAER